MTIRYAALDLDGTLIDAKDQPYEGVVEGLRALRSQGVEPLLVTGRSARSFRNLRHLDDLLGELDDEVLLSEGNVRLARDRDLLSFPRTCPVELTKALDSDLVSDLVIEIGGEFHASTPRSAMQFAMAYQVPRRQIRSGIPEPVDGLGPTSVTVFRSDVPLSTLVAHLDCEVAAIGPFDARVVRPSGTSKATALARHLQRRFAEPDLGRTLAIGDGATDASMLSDCATGIATQNADPVAVEAADRQLRGQLASFLHSFRSEGQV
ncbi:HAD hydrolase family protein [Streptomyces sp. NPDC005438]|uniref:HAD hydrolase family protein n=1 Tax=Streptomyces sp. NPDC005438 TaxID=3156880 RepID=UPI0033B002D4